MEIRHGTPPPPQARPTTPGPPVASSNNRHHRTSPGHHGRPPPPSKTHNGRRPRAAHGSQRQIWRRQPQARPCIEQPDVPRSHLSPSSAETRRAAVTQQPRRPGPWTRPTHQAQQGERRHRWRALLAHCGGGGRKVGEGRAAQLVSSSPWGDTGGERVYLHDCT
ncbi:hypothetical protein ZWY2020_019994 [Hordeum vulgare]|nr:hypothetical protein ZWY2020_019994 [Hordeum vulgare]